MIKAVTFWLVKGNDRMENGLPQEPSTKGGAGGGLRSGGAGGNAGGGGLGDGGPARKSALSRMNVFPEGLKGAASSQ